jgi:hydroxypyruvate reductase
MPEKVLVYSRFSDVLIKRLGQRYDLIDSVGKQPVEAFSTEQLSGIRAMVTMGSARLGPAFMDTLPGLGAIVCYGTGYDGIDTAAAAQRGIGVGHSPAVNAAAVADLAMTLMLAVTRGLLPADDFARTGNWAAGKSSRLKNPVGNPGRRIGIYGMGEIGRKIALRAAAFETEIGYSSRSRHDVPYRYLESLDALAEWSDVLMVAVRAGPATNHAINAGVLKKLGSGGYLINIARGSVVDQKALIAALTDKTIAGAGLDVFEKEPYPPDALAGFPNVVMTPHIGGDATDAHIGMENCVMANLDGFFAGQKLPFAIREP